MRKHLWLFRLSQPHLLWGIGAGLLMTLTSVLSFVFPLASQYIIDTLLPSRNFRTLALFSLGLVLLYLIQGTLALAGSYLSSAFGHRALRDIQLHLFHHAISLRMEIIERLRFGDISSRVMSDVYAIRGLLADNLLQASKDVLTFGAGLGIMLWLDWKLTLATTPMLLIVYILSQMLSKRAKNKLSFLQQKIGLITSTFLDPLFNFIIVKSYNLENFFLSKARKLVSAFTVERISLDMLNSSASQSTLFFTSLGTLIILWFGGSQMMQGSMSLGKLVAISFVFSQLAAVAQRLSSYNFQFKSAFASLERLEELRAMPAELACFPANGELRFQVAIEFRNAWFSYPDGRQALRGITFSVLPGETVALVGPNGAGKSTLVKLLLQLYEIQQGDILIAGKSIKKWNPFQLRALIAFVPQESHLFPVNLEENILIGRPDATKEEVTEAARLAGAEDFISKLPQGYETLLAETAMNLSGGERQRIALARAFLKNSPVLVLDEAVSQVDSQSDEMIREALRQLFAGRTVIIIAHRLSTVLQSDRIVVLNKGKVEAVGKHGEIYQSCQLYKKLCESQFLKLPDQHVSIEALP